MAFTFEEQAIPGVFVITPQVFGDSRGYFMETYKKEPFEAAGIVGEFVQDNESSSSKGVLRGLHFQKEHTQGKLVRVTSGAVYDVAVDVRPGSPTFGKYVGVELSAEKKNMFYIPPGFAHGFLVLSDTAASAFSHVGRLTGEFLQPRWHFYGSARAVIYSVRKTGPSSYLCTGLPPGGMAGWVGRVPRQCPRGPHRWWQWWSTNCQTED